FGALFGEIRKQIHRLEKATTFADGVLEQSLRKRRYAQCADGNRARRLPEDRDSRRITPKSGDVAVHPSQRRKLIEQSVIPSGVCGRFARKFRMSEKAEHTQAIIKGDDNDALLSQNVTGVERSGTRSAIQTPTINPDHD